MDKKLFELALKFAGFPFSQICVHLAALEVLSLMEETYKDDPRWVDLVKSLINSSAGDARSIELLQEFIGGVDEI
jgi:hypothetical protein